MTSRNRPNEEAVLEAISLDDLDGAAEQLAALRAYSEQPGDAAEKSNLRFDSIVERLDIAEPWYRRSVTHWAFGLGLATATALMLVAILPSDDGVRFKGDDPCCGAVTLRLGVETDGGVEPLASRIVAQHQELAISLVLPDPGWASLYDVHLANREVRELQLTEQGRATFSPTGAGKHVLLLVVTADRRTLSSSEVIDLLASLGAGESPRVDGQRCSVDLFELEVRE